MRMKIRMKNVWSTIGDEAAAETAAAAEAAAVAKAAEDKTFTQDQVNTMMAEEKRKNQVQTQNALDEAKALRERSNLNEQERTELDQRIEDMQSKLLTTEEKAKREKDSLEKKSKETITELTTDRDTWQNRYTDQMINTAITSAAHINKAFNAEHIVAILRPTTRLVEDVDKDGKKLGTYTPMVKFNDVDKDDKPITLDITAVEAVKRMTEMEVHLSLFEGDGTGGFGGKKNNRQKGSKLTQADAAKLSPKEYRKWKKENE